MARAACAAVEGGQGTPGEPRHSGLTQRYYLYYLSGSSEFCMRLHPAMKTGGRSVAPLRSATMSTQIVAQVREALFAKELRPGDFLGTEKDLAERFAVSRIVARDSLRTLEAQGVVEIKVGSGGGARIARGNARLFAEALAVEVEPAGGFARGRR